MDKFKSVLRPLNIKKITIPNRIVFPPFVTGYSNQDGTVCERQEKFYKTIGESGAGMVIVGATSFAPEGSGWMGNTRIDKDEHISGLKRLFDLSRTKGGVIGIQLYHCGAQTNTRRTGGIQPVAPSAVTLQDGSAIARELTTEEIRIIEDGFAEASKRAFTAGADFIKIHGAHGYLIDQFLSPVLNKRRDEYGGPLENRARFAVNIIAKVRKTAGEDKVVGVRIGADEFVQGGYKIEDSKNVCKWLVENGVDYINVSAGTSPEGVQAMYKGEFVKLASSIKSAVNVPVICVGAIKDLARAEEIISQGWADLVAIGRALVADPRMIKKALTDKEPEIVECIDCWECFATMSDDNGQGMKCPQNPDLP